MDPALEFSQLRSFAVLARELHFGRAAVALRMAQPALSQQIRRLEARLGFALFTRTSRHVALTDAGTAMLARVDRAFGELERGVQAGRQLSTGEIGTVTIGYVNTSMLTVLPDAIRRFRLRHPNVRLILKEMNSTMQIGALASGEIDIAFSSDFPADAAVERTDVWRDPLIALVPSEHPLAKRSRLAVSALSTDPFILFPRHQAPNIYDMIVGLCRANGFDPTIAQEAQSWHSIGFLVAAGLGVSIAPESIRGYRISRLRHLRLPRAAGTVDITMFTPASGHTSAAHLFMGFVRQRS